MQIQLTVTWLDVCLMIFKMVQKIHNSSSLVMFSKQNKVNDIENDANRPSQFGPIVVSAVVFPPRVHLNTPLHHHLPNEYLVCCWHLKQCQEMASTLIAAICSDGSFFFFFFFFAVLGDCVVAMLATVCNNFLVCSVPYWLWAGVSDKRHKAFPDNKFNKLISSPFCLQAWGCIFPDYTYLNPTLQNKKTNEKKELSTFLFISSNYYQDLIKLCRKKKNSLQPISLPLSASHSGEDLFFWEARWTFRILYASPQEDGHGSTGYKWLWWSLSPSRCVPFIREASVSPLSAEWGIFPHR